MLDYEAENKRWASGWKSAKSQACTGRYNALMGMWSRQGMKIKWEAKEWGSAGTNKCKTEYSNNEKLLGLLWENSWELQVQSISVARIVK